MDLVSVTWLRIYQLRTEDVEMHFWDSDPKEQITTEVPIRHTQLLIKSISEGAVRKGISMRDRLGLVRLYYIIHQSFFNENRCQ